MKKLKIFGYAWHTAHQYSLMKALPDCNFYYIRNRLRIWAKESRPEPKNLYYVDHYEAGKYDLAILHLDQQCLFDEKKGIPYNITNKQIKDIPKIVINHGTPHYADKISSDMVDAMREKIGDNFMIVNSKQAWKEWKADKYIIHGISGSEFKSSKDKKNRIITTLNPSYYAKPMDGWFDYYNRQFLADVKKKIKIIHIGHDIKFNSFEKYRKYISESLIYFNSTVHSPMPRSRTEAMLSGCCVVSTGNHDWDKYIQNGVNGFIINDQDINASVKLLKYLKKNPAKAKKIGIAGRKTALEFFKTEKYSKDWKMTINEVLNNFIIGEEVRKLKKDLEDLLFVCTGKRDQHQFNLLKNLLQNYSKKIIKV